MKRSEAVKFFEDRAPCRVGRHSEVIPNLGTALELCEEAGVQWDPEEPPKILPGDLLTHQGSGETFIPRKVGVEPRVGELWEIVPWPQEKEGER